MSDISEEPVEDTPGEKTPPDPQPETLPALLPETFTAACHSTGFDPTRTATLILKSDGTITAIANEITEVQDARSN